MTISSLTEQRPQTSRKPSFKEDFAGFFETPSREALRDVLQHHVGELNEFDFKRDWPNFAKVAKSVLAIGNSGGGGVVAGVEQHRDGTLEACGVATLTDKTKVSQGIESYIPEALSHHLNLVDFVFEASEYPKIVGKRFQVLIVPDVPDSLPFVSQRDGDGIREAAVYVRRGTNEEANYEELQRLFNRRLETGHSSTLELNVTDHCKQLEALYALVQAYHFSGFKISVALSDTFVRRNPKYPKEGYEDFIVRMIEAKKRRIERELYVQPSHRNG
jgi:Schlafen, AlbA_2